MDWIHPWIGLDWIGQDFEETFGLDWVRLLQSFVFFHLYIYILTTEKR